MKNLINTHFWYVTKPSRRSTIIDICFKANVAELAMQLKGGLKAEEIIAVFTKEAEAMREAGKLLVKENGK